MKKMELLAPAGDPEKLKMAFEYGADAVYAGGEEFGLRAFAGNFDDDELSRGIEYAHKKGGRVYIAMNIVPHDADMEGMYGFVRKISGMGADAVIVSDPGVFSIVREAAPEIDIHISTQAGVTNGRSALYWAGQGAKRIILARELSLEEVSGVNSVLPAGVETEIFVHGSMCISYSGRCLLSSYLAGRDANRGMCAHPCRWKYSLVEEKRPGEYMPVYENDRGTYIFNSKDLCMLPYIKELADSGAAALKIEGRMKSAYYTATAVKAYREELDRYYADPDKYVFDPSQMEEVSKASHREFSTGFYFGRPDKGGQVYNTSSYIRDYDFVGIVEEYDDGSGMARIQQRNRFAEGDRLEVVPPSGRYFEQVVCEMYDEDMNRISEAPHPQMTVFMPLEGGACRYSLLRRRSAEV
ncbi:MAG: U32 family peptidase [Eubacteriales bacterium]|nr:U32 family peptidase [Eubacteriales bacterium]